MTAPRQPSAVLLTLLLIGGCGGRRAAPRTSAEVLLTERMGAVLLREGRAEEAERAYRDALRDDPKNPDVQDGLGVSLLMQSKFKEALPFFNRAVDLAPDRAAYRINRGLALMELGRYREAEEDFRMADGSAIAEDRQASSINRGRLRQRQGDFVAAEAEFAAALAREPKSFAALLGRAVAREARGDLKGAAEDYVAAVRLEPKSAEANLRLGLVLISLKQTALGRRYLERTIELDPTGEAGARARLLLESGSSRTP
jgi:Tfp pilus assembly protein PilF